MQVARAGGVMLAIVGLVSWVGSAAANDHIYARRGSILCQSPTALVDAVAAARAGDERWFLSLDCQRMSGQPRVVPISPGLGIWRVRAYEPVSGVTGYMRQVDLWAPPAAPELYLLGDFEALKDPDRGALRVRKLKRGEKVEAIEQDATRSYTAVRVPNGQAWVQSDWLNPTRPAPPPPAPKPAPAPRPPVVAATPPDAEAPPRPDPRGNFLQRMQQATKQLPAPSQTASPDPWKPSATVNDAVRQKVGACWNVDPGAKNAGEMKVAIRVFMNPDGTVREAQIVDDERARSDPRWRAAAEAARRAVANPRCNPLPFPAEGYETWKETIVTFDPRDFIR